MSTTPTCYHTGEDLHLEHRLTRVDQSAPSVFVHPDGTPCKAIVY